MFSFKTLDIPRMEVEMEDGSVLHINPPSKRTETLLTRIFGPDDVTNDMVTEAFAVFMSDNVEGIKYEPSDFEDFPLIAQTKFLYNYLEFVNGLIAGKN